MSEKSSPGDGSPGDGSLDETLASGDYGPSPLSQTRTTAPAKAVEIPIPRGTSIGRYVTIEEVGSGTMGVVLSAFDATLDRKVALKLVRLDPNGATTGRQRLIREAQAMAKLAHPNVVGVFEVGEYEERVFLAMEFVAGSTLSTWIAREGRTQRQIVDAFIAAGRGLAAAHRAGIVHRDFKPQNVLVDGDDRVRVADFGLATAPVGTAPAPQRRSAVGRAQTAPHDAIDASLDATQEGSLDMTKTGALLGTPAYMSPEQHRGEHADARADQFSFCVALYEALYAELPFEGSGFFAYQEHVLAGTVREAPRGHDVPARLRRVLVRGLSAAPGDRYPSMDALLVDLARDPSATYKRAGIVGGAMALAGTLAFLLARGGSTTAADDPCALATKPYDTLWDAPAHQTTEQAFLAAKAPNAKSDFDRLAAQLDHRAAALRAARREACLATTVRHEQPEEQRDRRMRCLDERADQMRALINVLSDHPDAVMIENSHGLAMGLAPPEQCAGRMLTVAAPPAAIDAQVAELSHSLAHASALIEAGKAQRGLEEITALVAKVDQTGYAPLQANLRFELGIANSDLAHYEQCVAELRRAVELAAIAHDDHLAARVFVNLYGVIGYHQGKTEEARGLEEAATAAVARAGGEKLAADFESTKGLVDMAREDYPAAAKRFLEGARLEGVEKEPDQLHIANLLGNAGLALMSGGKYDEARGPLEKALAIHVELVGADTEAAAHDHQQLGMLYDYSGDPAKSLPEFQRELDISKKVYPEDNFHVAQAYNSVGVVLDELGRRDEALDLQQRALAILEKHPADNGDAIASSLRNIGNVQRELDKLDDATATLQRALELTKASRPDSTDIADVLHPLALVKLQKHDYAAAKSLLNQALAIREAKLGKDHPDVANTLGDLANTAQAAGDHRAAIAATTRALAIYDKQATAPSAMRSNIAGIRAEAELATGQLDAALADATASRDALVALRVPLAGDAHLMVAEVLWAKRKHAEAIAEAKLTLEASPPPEADVLAKARDWLAHHSRP